MRIHLHDGSGHPFQVQLSRALAGRGHDVLHTYATQWVSGQGRLTIAPDDPPSLRIRGITASRAYEKYSPARRTAWEISYTRAWRQVLRTNPYDVLVSCNTQLFTGGMILPTLRRAGRPWVLWHQDIAALAIADELARVLPAPLARPAGRAVTRLERVLINDATAVVAIGEPFAAQYRRWDVDPAKVTVIPNWAPLDEIAPLPRENNWAREHGLSTDRLRLLYAGTLGRKHNPQLLLDLLDACRADGINASLTVASEGPGADHVRRVGDRDADVRVLPFQPAEQLAPMLASADVLIAVLEPDASRFSIPSKVLSYLAAGRPVLVFAPAENPCVADVEAGGGRVVDPSDAGVAEAARWLGRLAADPTTPRRVGETARRHAEAVFDIERIADRFESVLHTATGMTPNARFRRNNGSHKVTGRSH